VLAGLDVLFTAFVVAQAVTAAGGAATVLETRGLTYAQYARSGFFQLVAVALITLVVLLALRAFTQLVSRRARTVFLALDSGRSRSRSRSLSWRCTGCSCTSASSV